MTRKNQSIASLAYQERRAKRRVLANQAKKETNFFQEEKMNIELRRFLVAIVICGTILCIAGCVITSLGGYIFSRPVESTVAPTNTVPDPTKEPAKPEVAATPIPAPVAIVCDTPSINASATIDDKTLTANGEYLKTNLGERMTFTSRRLLVSEKAWNDPLSAEELKTVEETWQSMQVCIPDGTTGVIFAGGFEQGLNHYENGVLLSLKPGLYEFRLRNGEAVIWYPGQETFASKDLERIFDQIRHGNFDIRAQLAFFGVTTDLLPLVPQDLVKLDNVQIVPDVESMVR